MLVNTAYAFLAGEADAADRVSTPAYLAAGNDPDDIEADLQRVRLDNWLNESFGRNAASERALLNYLKGA